jgi:uridine kinase
VRGDIIIVEDHHRAAAARIVDHIADAVAAKAGRYTITVAGESGSGKSETAQAIADAFADRGVVSAIYQQDDYFVYPPKTNDRTRREDIAWVGSGEVRLDLLDAHLQAALDGADEVEKPLVIYEEDRIDTETMDLRDATVVIAEGTYTSLLEHVDTRVFIARNRLDTMEHRMKRGREDFDPFIEEVLTIEHDIISEHRALADVVITRDYAVEFPEG